MNLVSKQKRMILIPVKTKHSEKKKQNMICWVYGQTRSWFLRKYIVERFSPKCMTAPHHNINYMRAFLLQC